MKMEQRREEYILLLYYNIQPGAWSLQRKIIGIVIASYCNMAYYTQMHSNMDMHVHFSLSRIMIMN